MTPIRIAYMPLSGYPEPVADDAIRAAATLTVPLGCALSVTTFAVDLPRMSSGFGDLLIDVPALVRSTEEKSKAECHRLEEVVRGVAASRPDVQFSMRKAAWSAIQDAAAEEARYFDLTLLPWSGDTVVTQEMAQAIIFASGRPVVLVPVSANVPALDHIAVAWDGSRVAARALGDALPFLAAGGRVTILTVRDEKPLARPDIAAALASALVRRGFNAAPLEIALGERTIAEALQQAALSNGARLLVMGGFGHSRIRDFVLGGATSGVLSRVLLPVLLSH